MNIPIGPHGDGSCFPPESPLSPPPPPPPTKFPPLPPPPADEAAGRFGDVRREEHTDALRGNETTSLGSRVRLIALGPVWFGLADKWRRAIAAIFFTTSRFKNGRS